MGSLTSNDGTITGIDTGDAIGAKVVFAAAVDNDNTTFKDWISDETIDIGGTTGLSVVNDGTHGYVLDVNEADDPITSFTYTLLGPLGTGITFSGDAQVMCLVESDDAGVSATKYVARSSGAGDDFLANYYRHANENFIMSIGVGATTDSQQIGSLTWTDWNNIGVSRNNPAGARTINNGTEGSRDTTATGDPNDPTHDIIIMNDSNGGNQFNGRLGMLVIFDEELTTSENSDFNTNPWRIFTGATASGPNLLTLLGVG